MNRVNTPWVDAEFKKNRATRRKLERVWKKSKSTVNRDAYIEQRNVRYVRKCLLLNRENIILN